ncbi:helix-turn-helix transcriptional regulator [Halomicroarcula sp. GCM10025710]
MKLLEDNGGRMKQVDIVDTTDWSKSKVSMLLSDMEDEGDISKLRVGRENIISLSGHEPDATKSPFDDE